MALFSPDIVVPGDEAGFGLWVTAHYLEHLQFISTCLARSPSIVVPNWDFWSWNEDDEDSQQAWAESHASVHDIITSSLGVAGLDFSELDVSNAQEFSDWQEAHRTEHQYIRTALGIV